MKKVQKTKRGFTLLEIVLVIAIIMILAAATIFAINDILTHSKQANSSVNASVSQVTSGIKASESKLKAYGF